MYQILTQCDESEIYSKNKIGDYNVDYKIVSDQNFRPEIPENFLNDEKYSDYISLMKECWDGLNFFSI
jgi:hypothetical protein